MYLMISFVGFAQGNLYVTWEFLMFDLLISRILVQWGNITNQDDCIKGK